MKKIIITLLVATIIFSNNSCKKDKGGDDITSASEAQSGDFLTPEELSIVDSIPRATNFLPSNILLPNGETVENFMQLVDSGFYNAWNRSQSIFDNLGPQDARNALISRLTMVAYNLTNRNLHQYPDEGSNKPAQNGLAYSWGGKDHTIRQAPIGAGTICTEEIHGLDCSGFIYQLFAKSGVTIPKGRANDQRQTKTIKNAIIQSIPSLDKVKVDDLGKLDISKFESGDIIYWTKKNGEAFHIGLVLKKTNGSLAVYMSAGTVGVKNSECLSNKDLKHGPVMVEFIHPYWFGGAVPYGVVRINADISGKWDFHLRCQGTTTDALVHNLKFPTDSTQSFHLVKNFIDYDGSPNTSYFDFIYDNTTNILSCSFNMTDGWISGFERRDHFNVKLNRDSTGYFNCTNDFIHNGTGCGLQVSLVNKE